MEFSINSDELAALYGLQHLQQLAYLRGIRPFMDMKTGIVGLKRGISYQSLCEELYIEPHQGFKAERYSRAQLRRALQGLERAGLISFQSEDLKLVLKCQLATLAYSAQNKAVTKPSQQVVLSEDETSLINKGPNYSFSSKADIAATAKAVTPHNNSYIYLLAAFEQFWSLYPEKKSKQKAWEAFQALNPNEVLSNTIAKALQAQINHRQTLLANNQWVPPWKYPANWLANACWEDEINFEVTKEKNHASNGKNYRNERATDPFCPSEYSEPENNNVIPFKQGNQR